VRALMCNPTLLLLDEPTVGLDTQTRRALVRFVHDESRQRGVAVLWATHLLDEAEPGDDLVVLARGEVVAAGSVAQILARSGAATLEDAFATLTEQRSETAA
jgi:ABC-2 type transport system ATP-binding protein